MANTIILKKSSVTGKVPAVGDLIHGELALNYADGYLYYKNSDGTIQGVKAAAAAAPTDGIIVWIRAGSGLVITSRSGTPLSISGQQSMKVPYYVTTRLSGDVTLTH
jgi:hypothetical protein